MKRYIYLLISCLIFATSCENFLDITPDGQVKRDELLNTKSGIEDALYGAYSQLRNASLYGQELSFHTLEILAQYFDCYGNSNITALGKYDYTNTSVKSIFEAIWTEMYKNISNVNSILDSDLIHSSEEFPFNIYKGEALGLRAFMHFDLLRLFTEQITLNPEADGIPYGTEFSLNTPDFRPAKEIYQLIIADLREAERLLAQENEVESTTTFMTERKIHFNLHAARATLARVYLTMGNNDSAYYYADKVITESGRTLTSKTGVNGDLAGVLSNNETIFGVYYAGFYTRVYPKLQQTVSFSSLNPRSDLMSRYETTSGLDYRSAAYFTTTETGQVRLSKLTDIYELQNIAGNRPTDLTLGINLIRLPEMYLIAAETLLATDYDQAMALYNEVITHRGLEALDARPTPEILTQEIINEERYKEFVGEGQTFFNMKRQNLSILAVDGETSYGPSNSIYVVPIPDIEYENRY